MMFLVSKLQEGPIETWPDLDPVIIIVDLLYIRDLFLKISIVHILMKSLSMHITS